MFCYFQRPYFHCLWSQYISTTCSNATEVAQLACLVPVDHSLLLTIASETVDTTDWPLPPESHLHSTNRCSLCRESNPKRAAYEVTALINAATQGITTKISEIPSETMKRELEDNSVEFSNEMERCEQVEKH